MADQKVVIQLVGDASSLQSAIDAVDRDLGQLVQQTDRAQAALGPGLGKAVNRVTQSTKRMNSSLKTATGTMNQYTAAQRSMNKVGRQQRAQLQNVGYQMQDTIVQLEMGTHWTRVLAQQGTQVLGIFGPMATLFGAVAAGVLVLGKAFFDMGGDVETATEEVDALGKAFDALGEAQDAAFEFKTAGSNNPFMEQILSGQLSVAFDDLAKSMTASGKSMSDAFGAIGGGLVSDSLKQDLAGIDEMIASISLNIGMYAQEQLNVVMTEFEKRFQVTADQARAMQSAMKWFEGTEGLENQVDVLSIILAQLEGVENKSEEIDSLRRSVLAALIAASGELERQNNEAEKAVKLANDLRNANNEYWKTIRENIEKTVKLANDLRNANEDYWDTIRQNSADLRNANNEYWKTIRENIKKAEKEVDRLNALFVKLGKEVLEDVEGSMSRVALIATFLANEAARAAKNFADIVLASAKVQQQTPGSLSFGSGVPTMTTSDMIFGLGRTRVDPDKSKGGGGGKTKVAEMTDEMKLLEAQMKINQDLVDSFADSLSDGFVNAITGAESWKDAMTGILQTILAEMLKVLVIQRLIGGFNVTTGVGTGLMGAVGGSLTASAQGNVFQGGNVVPFAKGGVVGGPTAFPMSGGNMGLMGESGPEAIMPLKRTSSGDLGVSGPPVVINNYGNDQVTVNQTEEMTEIVIGRAVKAVEGQFAQSMASGQGTFARSLESGYSARRRAV